MCAKKRVERSSHTQHTKSFSTRQAKTPKTTTNFVILYYNANVFFSCTKFFAPVHFFHSLRRLCTVNVIRFNFFAIITKQNKEQKEPVYFGKHLECVILSPKTPRRK